MKSALLPKGTRGSAVTAVLTLQHGDENSLFGQRAAAQAVAALLDEGSKTLTRERVQSRLDTLSTDLSASASASRVTGTLKSGGEQLPAAIALVGDLLGNSSFPPDVLDEFKRMAQTAIKQQR